MKDFMVYLIRRILADHLGGQISWRDLVIEIFARTRRIGIKPAFGPGWTLNEILRRFAAEEMLELSAENGLPLITPYAAVEPELREEFEVILPRAVKTAT
ncbi:MAG: hypothetical protein HYT39_02715 [Candidatus Sungbacteria bacterium]|nr:hypothetical protein [Candidatus Sungbacteria bacterium]